MTQCDVHDFIFIFSFVLLFVAIFRGYCEAEQLNANETTICGLNGGFSRSVTCTCAFWQHSHNLLNSKQVSHLFFFVSSSPCQQKADMTMYIVFLQLLPLSVTSFPNFCFLI